MKYPTPYYVIEDENDLQELLTKYSEKLDEILKLKATISTLQMEALAIRESIVRFGDKVFKETKQSKV